MLAWHQFINIEYINLFRWYDVFTPFCQACKNIWILNRAETLICCQRLHHPLFLTNCNWQRGYLERLLCNAPPNAKGNLSRAGMEVMQSSSVHRTPGWWDSFCSTGITKGYSRRKARSMHIPIQTLNELLIEITDNGINNCSMTCKFWSLEV